jgi:hypothetical protein
MTARTVGRYERLRLVGDVVYPPYQPQRVGRVVEAVMLNDSRSPYDQRLRVRWHDSRVTRCNGSDVLRLADLVEDHMAKAEGHRERMLWAEREIPL